jgi:hypothetical protein
MVREGMTHAECALVHMLESKSQHKTVGDLPGPALGSNEEPRDEAQSRAVLVGLFPDEP